MARQLKTLVIIGFFATAICGFSRASSASGPKGDGSLSLYSYRANESVQVTIHTNGIYDSAELSKVHRVMRCRGNNSVYEIDRRLVDLIDNVQDHFGADTVEIISGYRSPEFNKDLKDSGRGVATESRHTKGLAADIHIDEVSEEAVWKYVKSLNVGGAGLYPCYDFVHIDIGRKATWREADCAKRKLVGLDNNPSSDWKIVTNKNNYRSGDTIAFTSNKNTPSPNVYIEKFRRGVWEKQTDIDFPSMKFKAAGLPYGKYRIVADTKPQAYSNEFYIKKN